ncbi:diguanylate cyclase [Desulfobotulus sp.]|jgi:diguanylate cyclase (GGDEF)-like protein|uniref:diguanylate cyclase n=1 Tax=Desulfobotulus sp. TaxID=1940337 RepID=UPI002A36845D|nr:diguanylate cyclase [Desulfobotulus sp.]MDY0163306.1 diguanylate cyclase [Desulfobotulus sp.]
MNSEEQALFAREMETLRQGYRERLVIQLKELEELAASLPFNPKALVILEQLIHGLHKIAGGAGIFGMPELGKKAKILEIQVKGIRDRMLHSAQCTPPAGELLSAIRSLTIQDIHPIIPQEETSDPAMNNLPPLPASASNPDPHVLILDANARAAKELGLSLRNFGYIPRYMQSLFPEREETSEKEPAAVLLAMEGNEGRDGEEIRSLFQGRPPLIAISDSSDFSLRLAAARAGARGFFTRPLDVPKIVDCLEQIIRKEEASPYRVLIVDDDLLLAEHFRLVLEASGMEVHTESQPEKVLDRLSTVRPEILLMDVHMEGCSGPELANIIRMEEEWVGIPILYLSGEKDMNAQIRALESGGDDFITKPVDNAYLAATVSAHVSRARRLSELMAKDSLTGLLKHIRIKEALEVEMSRSNRDGSSLCVIMLDLDHFKRVNDTWGHSVGDRVIKALAHLLTRRLRRSDSIGRYGGEEFMVVLPGCGPEKAAALMDEIRLNLKSIPFQAKGESFTVTCSIGMACSCLGVSAEELLQAADKALYQAKAEGRDRICMAPMPCT